MDFLQILGFTVGLLYLWWEYHANVKVWLASVVMPAINMWVYLDKGLYADFAINIYYLIIAAYGYIAWTFNFKKKERAPLPITHLRLPLGLLLTSITCALWLLLAWILITFTDSTVPWWDAFTTALSIVALWMLARKIAEQWLAWMIVDAVCVGLYFYKDIPLYSLLYLAYTIIAILGYRKWLRLMKTQDGRMKDKG